jgi:hypothetical protein
MVLKSTQMFNKPASEVGLLNFSVRPVTPEAGLLNKGSCLAAASGVTKFIFVTDMTWV